MKQPQIDTVAAPTVYVVDDDPTVRYSLPILLEAANLKTECFASAEAFLKVCDSMRDGCLLLDVVMEGMSGPELQLELAKRQVSLPIIFLTGYDSLPTGVRAMKQGAVDFLTKPIDAELLLEAVQAALELNRQQRDAETRRIQFEKVLLDLTGREWDVLLLALSGMPNKSISRQLQISLRTVEGHRSRILLKTGVDSLLELAQQATNAGVTLAKPKTSRNSPAA